jgi:parvulin-like peptidyl-prolyl isomerase
MRATLPFAAFAATVALASSFALVGCGDDDAAPTSTPTADVEPEGARLMHASHILIAWKGASGPGAERTKAKAKELADEIIAEIAAGRPFDELWLKFTNENKPEGAKQPKPMEFPVTGPARLVEPFLKAARALAPGKISPEPVETEFGYHIIRREATDTP